MPKPKIQYNSTIRKNNKNVMSDNKYRLCRDNAKIIKFFRQNPCIACEELIGVKLIDSQKYMLANSWVSKIAVWSCTRNFGKSFMIAIFAVLTALLYEDQNIYIISSVGDQAKETFNKIEEIVKRTGNTSASIKSLKDIVAHETKGTPTCKDGFTHNPSGYQVEFYNGSKITTLNSKPDSNRGKRATLLIYDEAAFCNTELIIATKPFVSQESSFSTSTDEDFDLELSVTPKQNQIIFASSQDSIDTEFYRQYKESAKEMLAGNRDHFVCDMPCDTALKPYVDGKPYPPLLQQSEIDQAMKADKQKAMREYYNVPTMDGGANQIIKWGTVRRNEKLIIPYKSWKKENDIIIAFDPARTGDNSIIGVMNVYEDPAKGLCGDLIHMSNLIDIASEKKFKLDSNRQLKILRDYLLAYNGNFPDYMFIDKLLIDQGSGGGGVSTYSDQLLNDFEDNDGKTHKGLIDKTSELYSGYSRLYPQAIDKVRLISPNKYRTQMVEEFIELFELGVINIPMEYKGYEFINIPDGIDKNGEEKFITHYLTDEEIIALSQIDLMKSEITSIHKMKSPSGTTITYQLSRDKQNIMHDDRFYVMIMLAHRLYERRREKGFLPKQKPLEDLRGFFQIRAPKII